MPARRATPANKVSAMGKLGFFPPSYMGRANAFGTLGGKKQKKKGRVRFKKDSKQEKKKMEGSTMGGYS
jgi:hypothetical protein